MPTIIRPIKQVQKGGQGTVWEAEIQHSGLRVAMKYLTPNPASPTPDEDRARFLREVRCQSLLDHPNIIRVLGSNDSDDPPWYYMPWADLNLRDQIRANSQGMPESDALEVFMQILDAVVFAHREGILHRDLKPENVLFVEGRPQVSDFGLSRRLESESTTLTVTNAGMGTIAYGAPEQFRDAHNVDERADVFALGKILYELLTGNLPFPTMDPTELPGKYRYIVSRATENDPDRRYRSVEEMARELKLLVEESDALQAPTERAKRLMELIAAGDASQIEALHRLLIDNADDLNLYTQFLPYLTQDLLAAYARANPVGLKSVILEFDSYAEGGHPWSYTDTIASFLERIFLLLEDFETRHRILTRILIIGSDHNRFYVGDVFVNLARVACQSRDGTLMLARVLRDNPEKVPFIEGALRSQGLPQAITEALDSVAAPADPERPW